MRLLVTRPEPDGARTAQRLRDLGHEAMLAPLLSVVPVANVEPGPGPWDALLVTSANGARAVADRPRFAALRTLPLLTVGRSSAEAARAAGFADVQSAEGDAADLARLAAARFPEGGVRLLYLAGQDRARDLAALLAERRIAVEVAVVYRAEPAASFPPPVQAALQDRAIDGVVHFSRRSVETYLACAEGLIGAALAPVHYCLSERAAEPLRAAGAGTVTVAARPEEDALIESVALRRP
jgi:uroporphyrinogen-III synthase